MVVTDRPSTCTANSEHDFTAWPSSRTVHAPHWLVSHPTCVPVSPSASRRKWTSNIRGSTSRVASAPFTWIVMEDTMNPLPGAAGGPGGDRALAPGGEPVNTRRGAFLGQAGADRGADRGHHTQCR